MKEKSPSGLCVTFRFHEAPGVVFVADCTSMPCAAAAGQAALLAFTAP